MELQSAYQEELDKLERTSAWIDAKLKALQAIPRYYGHDFTEQALESIRENARRNLSMAAAEPYFGRLDFQELRDASPRPLYIGKFGVDHEETGEPLIIDWRAPVASLFYSFTGGDDPASYESPDGTIEGLVYLKRNLVVRKQILQRVVDTYTRGGDNPAVTDEFLLYRLGENKDNKLRDIVSTIQAEQDLIIRSAKNTALVIQGVAGSGKTTVALHRLAYLLYQYREQIRAEKLIIFAPNRMFLDYISSVLPELGVGHIQQTTFADWALELLGGEIGMADAGERLAYWFDSGGKSRVMDDTSPGRLKGSIAFMRRLDESLDRYEEAFAPGSEFEPWEGARLSAEQIRQWFYAEYRHYPLYKRKDRVVARIKRWIEIELDRIWEASRRKDCKKKASQRLRAYLKQWPDHTPFAFYCGLFGIGKTADERIPRLELPEAAAAYSARALKRRQVQPEDLAPLVHIHDRFFGIDGEHMFDHVVLDEAQDFSPFQVALLNRHVKNGSFTILGDLSQGIHAYQGILDWNEFLDLFPEDARAFHRLERSYRSTMEIIRFANAVLARSAPDAAQAVPVFRSGDKVKLLPGKPGRRTETILEAVRRIRQGSASTVAVIGRTERECADIHRQLTQEGVMATLIDASQRHYAGGLSVLPVYLAKGLEFDAVLLADVDEAHYGGSAQDARLLYVGCTRALHELWIHYEGNPSPLVETDDPDIVARVMLD